MFEVSFTANKAPSFYNAAVFLCYEKLLFLLKAGTIHMSLVIKLTIVWCALENDFLLINLSYYCTIVPRKLTPRIFTTTNSHWKNGDRLKQGKFTESQFIRHRIDIQLHFFPIHIVLACYG